jgi:hypothetical protein
MATGFGASSRIASSTRVHADLEYWSLTICLVGFFLLDNCRLILHGEGSAAQRMSVHSCGQHSYPFPLQSSRCHPQLLLGGFCSHF